jgi:hypothetical protein
VPPIRVASHLHVRRSGIHGPGKSRFVMLKFILALSLKGWQTLVVELLFVILSYLLDHVPLLSRLMNLFIILVSFNVMQKWSRLLAGSVSVMHKFRMILGLRIMMLTLLKIRKI